MGEPIEILFRWEDLSSLYLSTLITLSQFLVLLGTESNPRPYLHNFVMSYPNFFVSHRRGPLFYYFSHWTVMRDRKSRISRGIFESVVSVNKAKSSRGTGPLNLPTWQLLSLSIMVYSNPLQMMSFMLKNAMSASVLSSWTAEKWMHTCHSLTGNILYTVHIFTRQGPHRSTCVF